MKGWNNSAILIFLEKFHLIVSCWYYRKYFLKPMWAVKEILYLLGLLPLHFWYINHKVQSYSKVLIKLFVLFSLGWKWCYFLLSHPFLLKSLLTSLPFLSDSWKFIRHKPLTLGWAALSWPYICCVQKGWNLEDFQKNLASRWFIMGLGRFPLVCPSGT